MVLSARLSPALTLRVQVRALLIQRQGKRRQAPRQLRLLYPVLASRVVVQAVVLDRGAREMGTRGAPASTKRRR